MIIISNHTGYSISIYNSCISVQLSADETIEINKNDLHGDFKLHFCRIGLSNMQRKVEHGLETGGLRKKLYYKYEIKHLFPVAMVLNVQNLSQVILKIEEVSLRTLLLFKTIHIKKIICDLTPLEIEKPQYMFLNEEDKRVFLKLMRIGTAITFPAALLAILSLLYELFFTNDAFIDKIFVAIFLLGFIGVALEDFYYTIQARNWGSLDNKS